MTRGCIVIIWLFACSAPTPRPLESHRAPNVPEPRPKPRGTSIVGRVLLENTPVSTSFGVLTTRGIEPGLDVPEPRIVADPEGRFVISDPRAGEWLLVIVGSTFVKHVSSRALEEGRTLDVGDINVRRGFTIEGEVVDVASNPVPRATVQIVQRNGRRVSSNALYERIWGNYKAATGRDGRFRITGIAGADFDPMGALVLASGPGGMALPRRVEAGNHTLTFALQPPGRIRGNVAGAGPVEVIAGPLSFVAHGRVASNGDYDVGPLPAGTYDVHAFGHASKQVTVVPAQTTTVNFP